MASGKTMNAKVPSARDKSICGSCRRPNDSNNTKFCSTCPAWLCRDCIVGHQTLPVLQIHQLHDDQTSVGGSYTVCTSHSTSLAIYFCRTCKSMICAQCQLDSTHQGHEVVDVETKVKENKANVKKEMEKLRKVKTEMESALKESEAECAAADKELLEYGKRFSSIVEEKRQTNREAVTSYKTQMKQRIDYVSQNLQKCSLVDSKECPLNMTEIATMSSDMPSCRVPEKPTLIRGVMSLIRSLAEPRVTADDIRDELSKNGLQGLRSLDLTVDRLQLSSSGPELLLPPIREYLRKNKIVFKTCDNISSIVGEQVSIVALTWVQWYEAWLVEQDEENYWPGELQHYQTHPAGSLDPEDRMYISYLNGDDHRFISEVQATTLRSVFGCTHALPLASKRDLVNGTLRYFYIFSVRRIKKLNDVAGDVSARLFHGDEQLPEGRLFFNAEDLTEICRAHLLCALPSELGLLPYDEISVLV